MNLTARFAKNLKKLRTKKKCSQKYIADKAKVSVSYVSMLERGQRSPPLETIQKVAKVFNVDPSVLLDK